MVLQDIQVAVVCAEFKESFVRSVPAIENLLHQVFTVPKLEAYRPLVGLAAGVALYPQLHANVIDRRLETATLRSWRGWRHSRPARRTAEAWTLM